VVPLLLALAVAVVIGFDRRIFIGEVTVFGWKRVKRYLWEARGETVPGPDAN
jgi:hypothetical protein